MLIAIKERKIIKAEAIATLAFILRDLKKFIARKYFEFYLKISIILQI
jgi:hypothetical protein